jgi:hypothetical protein
MVFNATFNNIPIISWRSVLLVEETREARENHRPVESHWQTLSIMLYRENHRPVESHWQTLSIMLYRENHRPVESHWQTWSIMLYRVHLDKRRWSNPENCTQEAKYEGHFNVYGLSMGLSWSWSYGSWIYDYLCNQFLSLQTVWYPVHVEVYSIQHNWSSLSVTFDRSVVFSIQHNW